MKCEMPPSSAGAWRDPAAIHETGKRIRSFNNWLKNVYSGWLHGYALKNVVVFDYYDILTAHGISNWLRYVSTESKDGRRSGGRSALPGLQAGDRERAGSRMFGDSTRSPYPGRVT